MPLDLFAELEKALKPITDPEVTSAACGEEGNSCPGEPALEPSPI